MFEIKSPLLYNILCQYCINFLCEKYSNVQNRSKDFKNAQKKRKIYYATLKNLNKKPSIDIRGEVNV